MTDEETKTELPSQARNLPDTVTSRTNLSEEPRYCEKAGMHKRPGPPIGERTANKRPHLDSDLEETVHRRMIEAIYTIGLRHASPAILMEQMPQVPAAVTSERVKSHLQKHRNRSDRATEEFMNEYDMWLQKAVNMGEEGRGKRKLAPPPLVLGMMGQNKVQGGELAAYLTYSIHHESLATLDSEPASAKPEPAAPHLSLRTLKAKSLEYAMNYAGSRVLFPVLTEEERKSPLGTAFGHVMGTLYAMNRHFMQERVAKEATKLSSTPKTVTLLPTAYLQNPEWRQSLEQVAYQQHRMLPSAPAAFGYPGALGQFHPVDQKLLDDSQEEIDSPPSEELFEEL